MPAHSHLIESLERRYLLATVPAGFTETVVSLPISFGSTFEIAPDGKLFVAQQDGIVPVYSSITGPVTRLQADFFRDAPPPVNFSGERGLFGITFDPDYANNRFVYIHYTLNESPFPNQIARYTANASGDLALPGSRVVLLTLEPSTNLNHNGGAIRFGPDGKMYVALGDNGVSSNSQSIETLKGKILRINATPGDLIPNDNPTSIAGISGTPTGQNRMIWAAGLRNPFTFAFQPGTGRMFINDVGQFSWEEVNEGAPGRNFGWPLTEGDFDQQQFPDFTRPFLTYHHLMGKFTGTAAVGAAFYNPPTHTFPADYTGDYFFGDFFPGWIKRIDPTTKQVSDFADDTGSVVDLRVAPDGSLLYLTYDSGFVRRVQYIANQPPAVDGGVFDFDGVSLPDPPHRLRFAFSEDVSASLGPDDLMLQNTTTGQVVSAGAIAVSWDAPTKTATFTFPGFSDAILPDGNYTATLPASGITDADGNPLPTDHVFDFFVLAADGNRDGRVNLLDFDILAANFGQSPRIFSQGDYNYDGLVNLVDFNMLASRFGTILARPHTPDDPLDELLR